MADDLDRETIADNDRRVLQTWHEWEIGDGQRRIILCVETRQELRPRYPGFNAGLLERLISDATDMLRTSASPRIVPSR